MPHYTQADLLALQREYLRRRVELGEWYATRLGEVLAGMQTPPSGESTRLPAPRPSSADNGLAILRSDLETAQFLAMEMQRLQSLLNPQLSGPVKLLDLLRIVWRKWRALWQAWVAIAAAVLGLSLGLATDSTGGYFDSLYVALMAFTTIGYGDVSPKGLGARGIAVLLGLLGVVTLSLFVSVVWSATLEAQGDQRTAPPRA